MNKSEYIEELKAGLEKVDKDLRSEILEDYEEHFANGLKKGKTEEQICVELGSIQEFMKELTQFDREVPTQPKKVVLEEHHPQLIQPMMKEESPQSNVIETRQIIVKALFADVNITRSGNGKIDVNCYNEGNRKQQMLYYFKTWQDGDRIYAEVVHEMTSTGLFNFVMNPYMRINITVPDHFPMLDINSLSGDIKVTGVTVDQSKINSISGDISTETCNINQLYLSSKSGSLILNNSEGDSLIMDSSSGDNEVYDIRFRSGRISASSGDIKVNRTSGDTLILMNKSGDVELQNNSIQTIEARSISGDVRIFNTKGSILKGNSTSGDIRVSEVYAQQLDINTTSGDLDGTNLSGNSLSAKSKSGDIRLETSVSEYYANSISGDITVVNFGDSRIKVDSISGDIDVRLNNNGNGYEVNVQSVSGDRNLSFSSESFSYSKNGIYTFGNAGSKLSVKSTSGDIEVQG